MKQILVFTFFLFFAPAAVPFYLLGLVALYFLRRHYNRRPEGFTPTTAQRAEFEASLAANEEKVARQGPTIVTPAASFYDQLGA